METCTIYNIDYCTCIPNIHVLYITIQYKHIDNYTIIIVMSYIIIIILYILFERACVFFKWWAITTIRQPRSPHKVSGHQRRHTPAPATRGPPRSRRPRRPAPVPRPPWTCTARTRPITCKQRHRNRPRSPRSPSHVRPLITIL